MANTLADLRDCYDNMDEILSEEETKARVRLVDLCKRIGEEYGVLLCLFSREPGV
jgi:hypothetical protein